MIRTLLYAASLAAIVFGSVTAGAAELKEPQGFKVKSASNAWYFTLQGTGRKVLLQSNGFVYSSREAAVAGANAAAKLLCGNEAGIRTDRKETILQKGKYSVRVPQIDSKHQIAVTGESYDSKSKAERGLASLRETAGCSRKR